MARARRDVGEADSPPGDGMTIAGDRVGRATPMLDRAVELFLRFIDWNSLNTTWRKMVDAARCRLTKPNSTSAAIEEEPA